MTRYEISTPDGLLHRVDAMTHVRDTNGLTLYVEGGKAVAMFPMFNWMRVATEDAAVPTEPEANATGAGEVASPAASGE
ncbi:hypothetical protein D3C77_572890 [compost metagenome]